MLPQQYCLRWKYHHSNLQTMFSQLLERQAFCDVTLACEGRTIKAHKMVLSACSTYFDTILSQYEEKDPILIMKDVKFVDIKCLVEFMYKGEINVEHCHLATLLKTAEELRIKGLAEVSWRDDEACNNDTTPTNNTNSGTGGGGGGSGGSSSIGGGGGHTGGGGGGGNSTGLNGIQSVLPQVSTVMDSSSDQESNSKRKRGRPPIDDYDSQSFPQPKIANLGDNSIKRDTYSEEVVIPDNDVDWDDDQQSDSQNDEQNFSDSKPDTNEQYAKSENGHDYGGRAGSESDTASHSGATPGPSTGNALTPTPHSVPNSTNASSSSSSAPAGSGVKSESLAALESQWPDVIKMNDYLNTGRRPQFWEEPFTKRVMDAIKNKELEMKSAAELLGVSYGTLYGRYRDAYGCLKHPYRVRDFWSDQGPADILAKLQRQEVTLFRAAELLNVTPQTLSNYLISLNSSDPDASTSNYSYDMRGDDGDDGDDMDSGDDSNHMLPASPSIVSIETEDNITKTVLPNHPDITIIKKEKKKEPPLIPPTQNNHPDDDGSDH